ncbi:hypothetical protein, partial [Streptomyces sp. SID5910]|uniref:hypothetical protein n=1 Tax=Streptomyces sp. SID5910 TaxID=2690312 RepID=UPI00136E8981
MTVRRLLPALLTAALALSACDIPATGVVEAGEPATGVLEPPGATDAVESPGATRAPKEPGALPFTTVPLYFVSHGSLVAVPRTLPGGAELGGTVLILFKGPDPGERERGLTTELPPAGAAPTIRTDGATVTVELPPAAAGLSGTAVDQLACTVAGARLRQDPELGSAQVT